MCQCTPYRSMNLYRTLELQNYSSPQCQSQHNIIVISCFQSTCLSLTITAWRPSIQWTLFRHLHAAQMELGWHGNIPNLQDRHATFLVEYMYLMGHGAYCIFLQPKNDIDAANHPNSTINFAFTFLGECIIISNEHTCHIKQSTVLNTSTNKSITH